MERRVTEQGLRGITAKPATFYKAIVSNEEYDEQIWHGHTPMGDTARCWSAGRRGSAGS